MPYRSPIEKGGAGSSVADGAASVSTVGAGTTNLAAGNIGTFIFFNGATSGTINLPQATASLVNKSIWIYKGGVGTLDINAYIAGDGTDDIEGEVDVENTTTDTMAVIHLKCTSAGSWSVVGMLGVWQ